MKKALIVLVCLLVLAAALLAEPSQETKPAMKQALVKLNYIREPQQVMMLLQPFLSRDGRMTWSTELRTISLNDYPENVDKVLAFIKEIDVKPADILFTVQLVLASEDGNERTDDALKNEPVIKDLKSFLKYKSFALLDTSLVRSLHGEGSSVTMGLKGEFELYFRPKVFWKDGQQFIQLEVNLHQRGETYVQKESRQEGERTVTTEQPRSSSKTLIESNLTIGSGDKTVVGVSRTAGGDKGMILIISGKVVN